MSSPPNLLALAGLGLLLGFRHAFEPDHLAAVSTLATRQGRLLDACRLGLAWTLGHTASVGVVVGAIVLFGLRLPDRLWPAADLLVALLLIRSEERRVGKACRFRGARCPYSQIHIRHWLTLHH